MRMKADSLLPELAILTKPLRHRFLSRWAGLLALAAVCGLALPAESQGLDLSILLSGKLCPLTVKLKQLNTEWRLVTIHGRASASGNVALNFSGSSKYSTSQNNLLGASGGTQVYVTKGQTLSANGVTYLVAYHLPRTRLDLSSLLEAVATKTPPTATVLTPESSLPLSLLNVRTIASLEDVRVFNMKWVISQSEQAAKGLARLLKGDKKSKQPKK